MRKLSSQRKLYNCMKSFGPRPRAVDSLLLARCFFFFFFYQTVLLLRRKINPETVSHRLLTCPLPYVNRHCFSPVEQTHGPQTVHDVSTALAAFVVQSLSHVQHVDCSTPGFPALLYFPEFVLTHVHCIDDAIQPSHPLSPTSLPALSLS